MKSLALRAGLVLALMALLGIASAPVAARPAAGGTTRIPIENYFICCSYEGPDPWVSDDGILHVRDRVLQAVVTSNEDYHAGTGTNWANANIDTATGYATYHGSMEIHPDAYEGYWAGHWSMQITPGKVGGTARLQGYGELEGLSTKSELTPLPPAVLAGFSELCGGNMPVSGVRAVGFVVSPGGG